MKKPTMAYDAKSGILAPGKVWLLDLVDFGRLHAQNEKAIYAGLAASTDSQFEDVKVCPADPLHVTGHRCIKLALDLFGQDVVGDFVPFPEGIQPIISGDFAKRLRQSGLTGFTIGPQAQVSINQSSVAGPKLFYLCVTGMAGFSGRWRISGAANLCPHCKIIPMICPGCGQTNWPFCENCGRKTLSNIAPEYSDPLRFILDQYEGPPIVEGKKWGGSDFFIADGMYCVSNKAKEWMEKTHTVPIAFGPALLNTEGMNGTETK